MKKALLFLFLLSSCCHADMNFFGDSLTVGADSKKPFPNIISEKLNHPIHNYAISGSQIADQVDSVYSNPVSNSIFLTGFNDARYYGLSTNSYQGALESIIVWLTSGNKILLSDPSVIYTGIWHDMEIYGGKRGKYSQYVGNTLTFSISGPIIYISAIRLASQYGGSFEVTIDGIRKGIYDCNGFEDSYSKLGYAPYLIRFDGLTNSDHKVVIKHIIPGFIYLDFAATPTRGATLILGECLKMTDLGYSLGEPDWNHANDAVVSQYNIIINSMTKFRKDGLDVRIAHIEYDPYLHADSGGVHPSDIGHEVIAEDFLKELMIRN